MKPYPITFNYSITKVCKTNLTFPTKGTQFDNLNFAQEDSKISYDTLFLRKETFISHRISL